MTTVSTWAPSLPHTTGPMAALVGRADDGGTGAIGKDDARGAVGEVDPAGEPLGRDDQDVAGLAGLHRGRRRVQGVDESRAAGVHVVGAGRHDAEPVGELRSGSRNGRRHRARRGDDEVDVGGVDAGGGQRLAAGVLGHVDDRLVGVGVAPLGDAHPALDPLVVGVDAARDEVVRW